MSATLLGLAAALLAIAWSLRLLRQSSSLVHPPFPPGPAPIPLLGNVLGMNKDAPHLTYTAWSKVHGDIIYTRVLNQEIIILNSEEVANALLEKRSRKYSDRPISSIADLFGWDWVTSIAQYGPRFRLYRRLLHHVFNANAAVAYRPQQLRHAYEILTLLLDDPTRYTAHFTTFSATVVMALTYGYDVKDKEPWGSSMQHAEDIFLRVAAIPEIAAVCAAFPFLKALPAWVPGMGFKSQAAECRRLTYEALNAPYAWVKRRLEEGNAAPSLVADAITRYRLEDDSKDPSLVQAVKYSAGMLHAATVETIGSTLLIFVYLMMNHPQVQHRAQEEIDRVVGRQRLPDFDDRASLPYIDAVLRETMRWRPVAPLGVPHATTEDDIYQGYYIPKGAIVLANLWAMSQDEKKYPNPEAFIPERFLQDDGTLNKDTVPWSFGFGRRICPGRHVADASLWSVMVCILMLFRIEKTEGSENVAWSKSMTTRPLPFPCAFVPRDEGMDAQKLLSLMYASHVGL